MSEEDKKRITDRINEFLKIDNFELSINYLVVIHDYLFNGILDDANKFRTSNVKKRELTLNGDSVNYSEFKNMFQDLFKCVVSQFNLDYKNMDKQEVIKNISKFTAALWLCHPFDDGNTRTVAVYVQKLLQSFGYNVSNDVFKENSLYFRNALVKATYNNPEFYITSDSKPLEKFFEKLLYDNTINLDIDDLYIDGIVKLNRKH